MAQAKFLHNLVFGALSCVGILAVTSVGAVVIGSLGNPTTDPDSVLNDPFQVGDKIFNIDSCIVTVGTGTGSTSPATCDDLTVNTLAQNGVFGFQISGGIDAQSIDGIQTLDIDINYSVETATGEALINGANLFFNGAVTSNGGPFSFAEVVETITTNTGEEAQLVVSNPPEIFNDWIGLQELASSAVVSKDIFLKAVCTADNCVGENDLPNAVRVTISDIQQTYEQNVPEPATLGLLGVGLAGLGFAARRRRKNT